MSISAISLIAGSLALGSIISGLIARPFVCDQNPTSKPKSQRQFITVDPTNGVTRAGNF